MKIRWNHPARLDKIAREIIWWTNAIIAIPVIYLAAGLVPGDRVHVNTVGAVAMLVMLAVLDAAISLPCMLWRRKINAPALAPVRQGARW